jgi:enolase
MVAEIYRAAGTLMADAGKLAGVADEGGFWPAFATNEEALVTLVRAIERAGFRPGSDAALSLDVAASELLRDGRYTLGLEQRTLDRDQMLRMFLDWLDRYPIASIEDPFGEDDRAAGWRSRRRRGPRADRRRRLPHDLCTACDGLPPTRVQPC